MQNEEKEEVFKALNDYEELSKAKKKALGRLSAAKARFIGGLVGNILEAAKTFNSISFTGRNNQQKRATVFIYAGNETTGENFCKALAVTLIAALPRSVNSEFYDHKAAVKKAFLRGGLLAVIGYLRQIEKE